MKKRKTSTSEAYCWKNKKPHAFPSIDPQLKIQEYVGMQVSILRKLYNWEQTDLASIAFCSKTTISKLEHGSIANFTILENVADAFGVPVTLFFPNFSGRIGVNDANKFDFGATIIQLQKTKDITCFDLADALGITTQTLSTIRQNKRPVHFTRMYQLAQALEVDLDEICPQNKGACSIVAAEATSLYLEYKSFQKKLKKRET